MSTLLEQASLVMIPSGYKEDVVYSQIPTSGSGDLSFTRASNGTRINSAGLVEVCPWNLSGYSEEFNNAFWVKAGATITANDTTAPNGTATADKVLANSGNTEHGVYNATPYTSNFVGEVYTYSVYAKKGTVDWLVLDHYQGSYTFTWFNLNTGTLGTVASGVTATIESVGNGWYRCSCTKAITATTLNFIGIYLSNANNTWQFNAAGTESIYIWGAQVNLSTSKPYFPTTDRLNVPRLTYQNGGGGCPSLLLEKQSTNLITYSEQFDNAAWSKNNTTVTANATTSPDGTQNADKLIADNGASLSSISNYALQSITKAASAIQYTYSTFVKQSGLNRINIIAQGASIVNNASATFSLVDGSITTAATAAGAFSGASASVTNYGNGWYRCDLVFTTNTDTDLIIRNIPTDSTLTTGNGTNGILIYGAQLEQSSYPTSYIPTTSSSATRVADACSKTGISSLIGQTEGVLYWDGIALQGNYNQLMFIKDSSANQFIGITVGTGVIYGEIYNAGYVHLFQYSIGANDTTFKMALAYKTNDFVFYINGVQVASASTGTTPTSFDDFYLGNTNNLRDVNCQVKEAILFPTRLTNAELASLTTI